MTSLSLERYAEVAAELEGGRLRDEVLGRAGLSAEEWSEAQRVWLDRMGRELVLGRFELTNRYTQLFLDRQRALSVPPAETRRTKVASAANVHDADGSGAGPAPAVATPSYLAVGARRTEPSVAGAAPRAASAPLAATTNVDLSAIRAALPFDGRAPAHGESPPPAAPLRKRAPAALSGTSMAIVVPKTPALPFEPTAGDAPSASSPASADTPPRKRAPAALSGTSMAIVVPKVPALPFAPADGAAGAPAPPPPEASPSRREPSALSGTSMAIVPKGPALPFAGGGRSSANASPWAADVVGTLDGALPGTEPALPFDAIVPSMLPASDGDLGGTPGEPLMAGLSLQQYASLCVELAVVPGESDEILRRYHVSAEQRKALDDHWQGRIASDPMVWVAFDRAYQSYKTWFVASRAG